jgi:hypothetical protein
MVVGGVVARAAAGGLFLAADDAATVEAFDFGVEVDDFAFPLRLFEELADNNSAYEGTLLYEVFDMVRPLTVGLRSGSLPNQFSNGFF